MSFSHYVACPKCIDNGRDRRGDNLAMYTDGGGHCFSCGHHVHPTGSSSQSYSVVKDGHAKEILPRDFTREVPARAWQWLLKYGMSWKYWQPSVGWSEAHSRLIFTCGDFSIGRLIESPSVEGRTGAVQRKWHTYGNSHEKPLVFGGGTSDGMVVLVEDLISAHKVAFVEPTCQTIPLFGTRVYPSAIPILRFLAKPIVMWLDKDQQGFAQKRASWLNIVTGLTVSYVFTDLDPKELSKDQVNKVLVSCNKINSP